VILFTPGQLDDIVLEFRHHELKAINETRQISRILVAHKQCRQHGSQGSKAGNTGNKENLS